MPAYTREDIAALPREFRRTLINGISGFKSLCLCGTQDAAGRSNLSLVSNVLHVGADPPLLGLLFRPDTVARHSLENLRATGAFTLNHVSEQILRQAHQSSANYPREISEFEATGLEARWEAGLAAPFVAASPVQIGLRLVEELRVQANGTHFIVGEIVWLHLPEGMPQADGFADLSQAGTLTVNGLDAYYTAQPLVRLGYARPGEEAGELPWQS